MAYITHKDITSMVDLAVHNSNYRKNCIPSEYNGNITSFIPDGNGVRPFAMGKDLVSVHGDTIKMLQCMSQEGNAQAREILENRLFDFYHL
jgi:hypothetical protein